jgi:hypothetical protein
MKFSFFTLFILISYMGMSQSLNAELGFNENYDQSSRGVVCVNEYTYLVKFQGISGGFLSNNTLYKIDTLGNILWSTPVNPRFAETNLVYEIVASEDGGVYLLGYGRPTCDVIDDCFWYIQKYDPLSGNATWTRIWADQTCYEMLLTGLSLNASDQLVVNYVDSSGSYISTLGPGGMTSDSLEIDRMGISGFENLSGYEKVGFKADSIWGFDPSGNTIDSLIFSSNIKGLESMNDTLYVLTQDSIYKIDQDFQIIRATTITGFSNYSHLKIRDGNILFVSNGTASQDILMLNSQLQLADTITIPVAPSNDTYKDFNQLHFSAGINFPLTMYTAIRYLDYSLTSNQNASVNTTDIGIIGLNPISVSAVEQQNNQNIYRIFLEAEVLIKNYGTNTLNSCHINHYVQPTNACNPLVYNHEFDNLNLAPGDSMWLTLGYMHNELNYFPDSVIQREICIYTSHPNYKTDLNITNDNYCENVVFGHVGIREEDMDEFSLYPNPTTGVINLNLPIENHTSFSIFGIQGTRIMNGEINSNKLDISSLANGMYFIQFLSADHQKYITRKIVKE